MSSKGSLLIRVLAGGYLGYLGGKLLLESFMERPENYPLYITIGVVFLVLGIFWFVRAIIKLAKHEYFNPMGELEKDTEEEEKQEKENE